MNSAIFSKLMEFNRLLLVSSPTSRFTANSHSTRANWKPFCLTWLESFELSFALLVVSDQSEETLDGARSKHRKRQRIWCAQPAFEIAFSAKKKKFIFTLSQFLQS